MYSLNCKGRLISWSSPLVMGVLNITPDSFYEGSRIQTPELLAERAGKMLSDGAAILDVGGMSSRPGASEISEQTEMARVVPAIRILHDRFPDAIISVDSYRYEVVKESLKAGASIINDIGADESDRLAGLAIAEGAPYIRMHMRGTPQTMQQHTHYEDLPKELLDYFIQYKDRYLRMGLKDLIIDPGFGFAKTIDQNFHLLKHMKILDMLDLPVLVGLSRKATIYKTLNIDPANSLNGTTVLNTLALQQGASILRVHDVLEAVQAIRLWTSYTNA